MTRVKTVMTTVLGWLAAFLLIVMAFLVLFQVFTRYVLDDPASFTEELVRYFLIWTGFIGGAYAIVTRQHMALVFVRDRFGEGPRRWLMAFADGLVLVFALVVIVIGGTQLAIGAWGHPSPLLGVPRGLVYAVAPVAGLFIVLAPVINVWEDVTGKRIPNPHDETADEGAPL